MQGILQRFVPPNGKQNLTIQAVWSPHVTLVEKRQNVYGLCDKRFAIFERVVTYEGPTHFSRQAFVAPHIEAQIKGICDRFTEHFYNTEHMNISRMVLYFKVILALLIGVVCIVSNLCDLHCAFIRSVVIHFADHLTRVSRAWREHGKKDRGWKQSERQFGKTRELWKKTECAHKVT